MSSLMDSMLLEEYRDPREVWIALRTDGVKGTGTIDDPLNATVIPSPPVSIASLTRIGSAATALTSVPHGFGQDDLVTISGVDIQLVSQGDLFYLGTFAVNPTGPNSFTYAMLGTPPSAAATPLAGGSIQCWRERERFDVIMRQVPANSLIHLGVGVFETKGSMGGIAGGWNPKTGQRIVGSGMGLTRLKLVGASAPYTGDEYHAIKFAYDPALSPDGFEVTDLTVDCNVDGQLHPQVSCGAIAAGAGGRHVRLRRCRAIHFGSRGPFPTPAAAQAGISAYKENFVFYISGGNVQFANVVDAVIEDCVAEWPSPDVAWNSTVLLVGGSFDNLQTYFARGCVLRNNYVNGELIDGPPAYIQNVQVDGDVVTLTTRTPHGRSFPGNVSVQGVRVNGSTNNRFNGVFKIDDQGLTATQLKYTAFVAAAGLGEETGSPAVDAETRIGAPVLPHALTVTQVTYQALNRFRVDTVIPHNLTVNNCVQIGNVNLHGFNPAVPSEAITFDRLDSRNPCNGVFSITNVLSKTKFDYTTRESIAPAQIAAPYTFSGHLFIGLGHALSSAPAGTGSVLGGNRFLHGATGGPWNDTASSLDLIARNNYYHDVWSGPNQNMGYLFNVISLPHSALTHDGTMAICAVGSPHGLAAGQVVLVHGALVNSTLNNPFNGAFIVQSKTTTTFSYQMTRDPSADLDPGSGLTIQAVAAVSSFIIENNVIESSLSVSQGYWPQPTAVFAGVSKPDGFPQEDFDAIPYVFQHVLARGNMIRQVNGQVDGYHAGITVRTSKNLRAEDNLIDVRYPMQFNKSVSPTYFNNRDSSGRILQGYDEASQLFRCDLATRVEDVMVLGL